MQTFSDSISQFIQFIKQPEDRPATVRFGDFQPRPFFHLLAAALLAVLLVLPLLASIEAYFELDLGDHKVTEILKENVVIAVVFIVVIGPVIEELLFRYWITFRRAFFLHWAVGILTRVFDISRFKLLRKEKCIWEKFFPYIFYMSAVLFALIHISNFSEYKTYWWLAPLYTLPQLIIGLALGYIRIKQGFMSSWFFHSCYNLIIVAPFFLFGDQ